jgi:hypothetical protein
MHQHNGEPMLYCEQKSSKIIKYLTKEKGNRISNLIYKPLYNITFTFNGMNNIPA